MCRTPSLGPDARPAPWVKFEPHFSSRNSTVPFGWRRPRSVLRRMPGRFSCASSRAAAGSWSSSTPRKLISGAPSGVKWNGSTRPAARRASACSYPDVAPTGEELRRRERRRPKGTGERGRMSPESPDQHPSMTEAQSSTARPLNYDVVNNRGSKRSRAATVAAGARPVHHCRWAPALRTAPLPAPRVLPGNGACHELQ